MGELGRPLFALWLQAFEPPPQPRRPAAFRAKVPGLFRGRGASARWCRHGGRVRGACVVRKKLLLNHYLEYDHRLNTTRDPFRRTAPRAAMSEKPEVSDVSTDASEASTIAPKNRDASTPPLPQTDDPYATRATAVAMAPSPAVASSQQEEGDGNGRS